MTGPRPGQPPRAVAVSDLSEMRVLYAELLRDEGFDVTALGWDAGTLGQIDDVEPDLVVVDCAFGGPRASAVVAQAIRRRSPLQGVPHLICTTGETGDAAVSFGPTAVLTKPFDLDQFCEAVRMLRAAGPPHLAARAAAPPLTPAFV